jgi:hypothetical protein
MGAGSSQPPDVRAAREAALTPATRKEMMTARRKYLGQEPKAWLDIYATAGCFKVQALRKTDAEGTDAYHLRMQQAALWCVYDALAKEHPSSHIGKFMEEVVTVTSETEIYRELIRTAFITTFWHEMDEASRPMLQEKLAFAQSDKRRTLSDYDSGILRRCAELLRTMRPEELRSTGDGLLSLRCAGLYERMQKLGEKIDALLPADASPPRPERHSEQHVLWSDPRPLGPVVEATRLADASQRPDPRHTRPQHVPRPQRPVVTRPPMTQPQRSAERRAEPLGIAALTAPFLQQLSARLREHGHTNTWILRPAPGDILEITAPGRSKVRLSVTGLTKEGIWDKVYRMLQAGTLVNAVAKGRFPQRIPVYNFGIGMLDAAQRALGP